MKVAFHTANGRQIHISRTMRPTSVAFAKAALFNSEGAEEVRVIYGDGSYMKVTRG